MTHKRDPWYKATFQHTALDRSLQVHLPHDVFSTQQIDEGTLLLLEHLPQGEPKSVLDMGCGYGALGLPIASKFPETDIEMVDRDLLAVKWSQINALENHLPRVVAYGSLGFRDIHTNHSPYDWILCNVPARIGRPFIKNLLGSGRAKVKANGEVRVVVIRDLGPLLIEIAAENKWPLLEIAKGPRHTVFSLPYGYGERESEGLTPHQLYLRDQVEVEGLKLDRPYDLGGDDPKRLSLGLPVLIDALPRQEPKNGFKKILCFRCGYGQLPLLSRNRWPEAKVIAIDRDLLATTFTRSNAVKLNLHGEKLEIRETAHFPDALTSEEAFDLILGELSPSAGGTVLVAELESISNSLKPGGQALLLALDKIEKQWIRPFAAQSKLGIHTVIARDGYTVLRLGRP